MSSAEAAQARATKQAMEETLNRNQGLQRLKAASGDAALALNPPGTLTVLEKELKVPDRCSNTAHLIENVTERLKMRELSDGTLRAVHECDHQEINYYYTDPNARLTPQPCKYQGTDSETSASFKPTVAINLLAAIKSAYWLKYGCRNYARSLHREDTPQSLAEELLAILKDQGGGRQPTPTQAFCSSKANGS